MAHLLNMRNDSSRVGSNGTFRMDTTTLLYDSTKGTLLRTLLIPREKILEVNKLRFE